MGCQECAQVPANPGMTKEPLWRHKTLTCTNIRIIAQIDSKAHSELHFEDISYFKENFYLCNIRKEIVKKHTEKDSVFAVGSVSQFWKNCKHTGDNVHERLRFAWA